ncbi:MAG: carboxylating nicotinate-nucleotide diphosphorylase [Hydrogenobaculum sp.]|nr:MAG: nicotinate-nucleotide diphosphorylase (carboxylating) [Hydrogenobaculum sp.]
MNWLKIDEAIKSFLEEDIGWGDITSSALPDNLNAKGFIKVKEAGVVSGIFFAKRVFELLGVKDIVLKAKDGDFVDKKDIIMELFGSAKALLMGERVALNLIQSLSGIATETKFMVDKIKDFGVKLLDTRKTTPGYRFFEKYAVRTGAGTNHRFALYDMVLIKDNHINLYGSISKAVKEIRKHLSMAYKIEVEVSNFEQLEEAISLDIDFVLLDNFTVEDAKKAIELVREKSSIKIELSGEINKSNIEEYAKTRPDYISSGAIIHSSKWLNASMDILI